MDDSIGNSNSLVRWFHRLPESQRRVVPIVVVAVVIAGGWLATQRTQSGSSLTLPQGLTPAAAVAHLTERGIADAKPIAGGKLSVPAAKAADAKRFLDDLASVSTTWADEWEKSNSQLGQFSGHRERDAAKEIARARMIGRLLRQMPGIAQADVVWDEEESTGWRSPQKTRCTVYLRPKTGFEISSEMAHSVRQAVAGSKKHLAAGDIVVMDLDRMTTFDAVPTGVDDSMRTLIEREAVDLRHQLETALQGCPGVRVNVSVNWQARDAESTIELTSASRRTGSSTRPIVLASSNGFLEQLSRDEESAGGQFEPVVQVTITAPEDSAAKWADQQETEVAAGRGVKQASFERPGKGKGASSFRQSVCSLLSRFDHRNLATGVSVHLTTTTGTASAMETIEEERTIDPAWFFVAAIVGCFIGAWVLSNAFKGDSTPQLAHDATGERGASAP